MMSDRTLANIAYWVTFVVVYPGMLMLELGGYWSRMFTALLAGIAMGYVVPVIRRAWRKVTKVSVIDEDQEPLEDEYEPYEEPAKTKLKFSTLRKQFAEWMKENPEVDIELKAVLEQLNTVKRQKQILKDLLRDGNHENCEAHEALFKKILKQMRQNFADMMNIFILAGANLGQARRDTLNIEMFAAELEDNSRKLAMLKRLNEQVLKTINQGVNVVQDIELECELSALERYNALKENAEVSARAVAAGESPFITAAQASLSAVAQDEQVGGT